MVRLSRHALNAGGGTVIGVEPSAASLARRGRIGVMIVLASCAVAASSASRSGILAVLTCSTGSAGVGVGVSLASDAVGASRAGGRAPVLVRAVGAVLTLAGRVVVVVVRHSLKFQTIAQSSGAAFLET